MRAIQPVLLAWAALGGAALAQDPGKTETDGSKKTDVAPIHFDLAAPKPVKRESLPAAATLGDLRYANEKPPAAEPEPQAAPKAAVTPAPRPVAHKPVARPAPKLVVAQPAKGPWMSEWRRAYIAKHGHQPPVPAR